MRKDPQTPSTAVDRVETETSADGVPITRTPELVSQTREGQPEKLRRRLRGDLDNIVLKALQKAPERHHGSVEEFSEDIENNLRHLPIKARPTAFAYRISKFVQRHNTEVVSALAALLLTTAVTLVASRRRARFAPIPRLPGTKAPVIRMTPRILRARTSAKEPCRLQNTSAA